ncbi:MAG: metallophosphoesterase [Jatrophihabitantaceae bacterium]
MPSRLERAATVMRSRVRTAATTVRRRPRHSAAIVAQWLLRWFLRITIPLAGAGAMLHLFPYNATAGGVHFQVQGTVFTRSGLTADTTFGSWEFPHVDGLPIGIHLTPENVDVVTMSAAATHDGQAFVDRLRSDFQDQVPQMLLWVVGEALIGVLLGLAIAAAINLAIRQLRGEPRREQEVRHRLRQFAAAVVVMVVVGAFGALTYHPDWAKRSHLTGTLAALQLFPDQLKAYYQQQATAFDVVSGIAAIQAELQKRIDRSETRPTAYNIMLISDMHLAPNYPLVKQYATNFDVRLIINTGDESAFGTTAEMTPAYLKQIRDLTKDVPMIWLAGNHDSPDTVRVMRSIPGVTVIGGKSVTATGGYDVAAQQIQALGLQILGIPDPRTYGAAAPYGSDASSITDPLERTTMDAAVRGVPSSDRFDIAMTHEPVAADELAKVLPDQIRQLNSGHTHRQNADSDVQNNGLIRLVEGSTGAGGLKKIDPSVVSAPIEFSIESVAADCQFTKVVRFQLTGSAPSDGSVLVANGRNVAASTLYLNPQKLDDPTRTCSAEQGLSAVQSVP